MQALVWFRSDLRVDDNPALIAAMEPGEPGVAALFLVCTEQWRAHDWGERKIEFVLRSVQALERRLSELSVPLIVRDAGWFSRVPKLVDGLMDSLGASSLFANREYEVNERHRDRAVRDLVERAGRETRWFHDQVVVPPGELRTKAGRPFSVYSPFRRAWIREAEETSAPTPVRPPERAESSDSGERPFETDRLVEGCDEEMARLWPAGEIEAHRRLKTFVGERARLYRDDRDFAARAATSRLSPYLAVGALSPRRCLAAALDANRGRLEGGEPGIDTWIGELIWREFYRHVLVGFPRVSRGRAFRKKTERVMWRRNEPDFAAWCEGRTGTPLVDAGMRELAATGWMHNRVRMVTAMFLTKDLLIDWRWGERFFMRHLVDADLANNNGGWQWSASTGVDAAPYFRIFNPWTQAKRYDADAEYIRRWIPELAGVPARSVHDPERLATHLDETGYPAPIVRHAAARIRALGAFERLD